MIQTGVRVLTWVLLSALLLAVGTTAVARAQGEGALEVPVVIDEARGLATLPLQWLQALIGAHNEQVLEIQRLKRGTGCS